MAYCADRNIGLNGSADDTKQVLTFHLPGGEHDRGVVAEPFVVECRQTMNGVGDEG